MQLYENKPDPDSARFYANRPSVRFHSALSIPEQLQRDGHPLLWLWKRKRVQGRATRLKSKSLEGDLRVTNHDQVPRNQLPSAIDRSSIHLRRIGRSQVDQHHQATFCLNHGVLVRSAIIAQHNIVLDGSADRQAAAPWQKDFVLLLLLSFAAILDDEITHRKLFSQAGASRVTFRSRNSELHREFSLPLGAILPHSELCREVSSDGACDCSNQSANQNGCDRHGAKSYLQ